MATVKQRAFDMLYHFYYPDRYHIVLDVQPVCTAILCSSVCITNRLCRHVNILIIQLAVPK